MDDRGRFLEALNAQRIAAGNPSLRELARRTHYARSTLDDYLKGRTLPPPEFVAAFVAACAGFAGTGEADRARVHELQGLHSQARTALARARAAAPLPGAPNEPGSSATEPDTTEPDTTEPDTTEPDTTEPNTTEPNTTEPDTTEPDTTEPAPVVEVPPADRPATRMRVSSAVLAALATAALTAAALALVGAGSDRAARQGATPAPSLGASRTQVVPLPGAPGRTVPPTGPAPGGPSSARGGAPIGAGPWVAPLATTGGSLTTTSTVPASPAPSTATPPRPSPHDTGRPPAVYKGACGSGASTGKLYGVLCLNTWTDGPGAFPATDLDLQTQNAPPGPRSAHVLLRFRYCVTVDDCPGGWNSEPPVAGRIPAHPADLITLNGNDESHWDVHWDTAPYALAGGGCPRPYGGVQAQVEFWYGAQTHAVDETPVVALPPC